MDVSQKSLSFVSEHVPNITRPAMQTVHLTGMAKDNKWKVTGQPSWLTVTPSEGRGDATLEICADAKDVSVGNYDINLTISGDAPECRLAITLRVAVNEQRQRDEADRQRNEAELREETEAEQRQRNEAKRRL